MSRNFACHIQITCSLGILQDQFLLNEVSADTKTRETI